MTPEKKVKLIIDSLLNDDYFKNMKARLDAGIQRKTLNVQAWEHLLLAKSLFTFHLEQRLVDFPEIENLDDDDPTNDNIAKEKPFKINDKMRT